MGLALPGEGLTLHEVPAEGRAELYDRALVAVGASGSDQIGVKLRCHGTIRTWTARTSRILPAGYRSPDESVFGASQSG